MLSPKRSFFIEPTDLTGAPPPLTPTARKVHNAFPYIWVSLVVGTVVMTGALYATLQRAFPRAASSFAAATPHSLMYHDGDAVCVTSAVDVRSMASNDPNTHVVWTAAAGDKLKVFSPQTYAVDGIVWLAVAADTKRLGYAPTTHVGPCSTGAPAYSDTDVEVAAHTVWAEAHGEPQQTLQAVTWSIINRARDPSGRWPRQLHAVCKQRGQYALYHTQHIRRAHPHADPQAAAATTPSPADLQALRQLIRQCLDGELPDLTSGAQHAFPIDMPLPAAADAMRHTATVGHFRFYRQ